MDQERQIRFAIPPFFFFASLLWGLYLAGCDLSWIFHPETTQKILGVLGAAAVLVLPVGFLISATSVLLLRFIALIFRVQTYEAVLNDSALGNIWGQLKSSLEKENKQILYASATFDHELMSKSINKWFFRRWTSFNVAVHSIVALLLAHFCAFILSIPQVCKWWWSTFGVVVILFLTAIFAWRETMRMIEFQSYRQQSGEKQ